MPIRRKADQSEFRHMLRERNNLVIAFVIALGAWVEGVAMKEGSYTTTSR